MGYDEYILGGKDVSMDLWHIRKDIISNKVIESKVRMANVTGKKKDNSDALRLPICSGSEERSNQKGLFYIVIPCISARGYF